MKKALLSLPFAARLRESSIRLLLTMSEFIESRRTDPKPSSAYRIWNTRKAAVLRSLGSPDSRRGYQHAIDEFVAW
jgi:hypothetical protein